MLDAEEAVPSRVWDAVSAELDKAAAPKVVPLWRRVIPVAAAVAAAVALGVFLALRGGAPADPDAFDKVIAVVDTPEAEPVQTALPEEAVQEIAVVETPVKSRRLAQASPALSAPEAVAADVPEAAAEPAAEPAETAARPSSVPSGPAYSSDEAAFNALAFEEERSRSRSGRFTVSAGSNVQTNGNPSSSSPRHFRTSASVPQTGITEGTNRYYGIPVAFGIGVGYRFSPKWSVSTGLIYTGLSRNFTGVYTEYDAASGTKVKSVSGDVDNLQQYLGIPLNLRYHMLDGERIHCYSFIGGTIERCLSDQYRIQAAENVLWTKPARGVQASAAVGLGIEFALTPHIGLYVDPSLRYWFDCGQSKSIRTQQPLMAGMEVGVRFGW